VLPPPHLCILFRFGRFLPFPLFPSAALRPLLDGHILGASISGFFVISGISSPPVRSLLCLLLLCSLACALYCFAVSRHHHLHAPPRRLPRRPLTAAAAPADICPPGRRRWLDSRLSTPALPPIAPAPCFGWVGFRGAVGCCYSLSFSPLPLPLLSGSLCSAKINLSRSHFHN
jgi:hypothetical protein